MISISKKLTRSAQTVRVSSDWISNGHWAVAVSELRPGWDSNIDVDVEPMPKIEIESIAKTLANADCLSQYVPSTWINDSVGDQPARILVSKSDAGASVAIMIDYWCALTRKGSIAWVKGPLEPVYLTHDIKVFDASQVYAIVMPMRLASTKVPR